MQTDIMTIGVLIAGNLIISIVFFIISLRIGKVALALIDEKIESTVNQMYIQIDDKIQATVDGIGEMFGDIFEKPTVKKAFGIIGSQGGQATANRALTDKIAMDMLNGPKLAGLKLIASGLGMDIDEYIEEHGAVNTLQSINALSGMVPGLDLGFLMQGGMNPSVGHEANHTGKNPYRGG